MEHVSKIQEEFNMIKISVGACQYSGENIHPTELSKSKLCFKYRCTLGNSSCYRYHLSRNTQFQSSFESHWNQFSLVTWSRQKECEWLISERKKIY